jgi:hypothetical protein
MIKGFSSFSIQPWVLLGLVCCGRGGMNVGANLPRRLMYRKWIMRYEGFVARFALMSRFADLLFECIDSICFS